jgi:hypothetical protein
MSYTKTDLSALLTEAKIDQYNVDKKISDVILPEVVKMQDALNGLNATGAELNAVADVSAGAARKVAKVALPIVAATTETDTPLILPAKSIILGAYLLVVTKEATGTTKTVTLGIKSVDADGLLKATDVSAAGVKKGTLLNTGQTLGALLCVDEGGSGSLVPEPYVCAAAATITYSLGSNDFAELVAYALVDYIEVA